MGAQPWLTGPVFCLGVIEMMDTYSVLSTDERWRP